MTIKRRNLFLNRLLILALVVYTLILYKDSAIAQENQGTKRKTLVEAHAHVDKNEITIGDKIKLGIRVKFIGDIAVQFPEFNQQLGVFTVKETTVTEGTKSEEAGYSTVERNYVLSSYEIGSQTIPPLKITYKGKLGEGEVVTDEISVDIKGVLTEDENSGDIKDILAPLEVPVSFKRLITWVCGGLGVLSLLGIIYWLIHKRKWRQERQEQKSIKRAPHQVAYELLEKLSEEDLITKGLIKEYYYRITDILRHYIEDRFGLLAPERTTEEFLAEMARANKLENIHKLLIQDFLERCDMVKYAKYEPSKLELQETYDAAKRLIDETRERLKEEEVSSG
ncbi:MAG: hypothetical protein HS132_05820 [Planctomycetia bacterium]|nr:hypothetical protein [Planctomycetia bacterium]